MKDHQKQTTPLELSHKNSYGILAITNSIQLFTTNKSNYSAVRAEYQLFSGTQMRSQSETRTL